jgi:glycosyltransferase involved in cell wall biosynthesis
MRDWFFVTPEYPPEGAGVADYARQVAAALGARGENVEVWSPGGLTGFSADRGVTPHRLPDRFGFASIRALGRALSERPDATIVLQYVPQPFGLKGLNLPFFAWLCAQPQTLWIMFHEVVYPFLRGDPLRRKLLAAGTRASLALLGSRADRAFVSIPGWIPYLETWARLRNPPTWAPVPSNLPTLPQRPRDTVRASMGIDPSELLLATFGTLSHAIAEPLLAALPLLLRQHPERRLLLIGRNSREFAARLGQLEPSFASRVIPSGEVDRQTAADLLAASDLGLYPFLDGASGRRTSLMAALALGVPVVTTEGALSEPLWRESGAVSLTPAGNPSAFAARADEILENPAAREALGKAGKAFYEEHFALERVLAHFLGEAPKR